MNLFLTALPFYIALLFLIQLIPVRINLFFVRENKNDFMTMRVNTFFSLLRFNVEVPVIQQKTPLGVTVETELKAGQDAMVHEEIEDFNVFEINWEKLREYAAWVYYNREMFRYILRFYLRAMTVEKLVLKVRTGLDDAAATGMVAGIYWTAAGTMTALAQQWLRLKAQPVVSISPDFSSQPVFSASFDSVVSFRIGHFTIGGLLLLVAKIRGGRV